MRIRTPAMRLLGAGLVAGAMVLAACGGDEQAGPDPASITPAGAPLFVDVLVRPEDDAADGARDAIALLTGTEDPGDFIVEQLDDLLAEQDTGVTYEGDIEPWLGERAGFFLTELAAGDESSPALMFAVTDGDAAQETVDQLNEMDDSPRTDEEYEGVSYSLNAEDSAVGFVDEFLVIGNRATFEATVDASSGDSLADDDSFSTLIEKADPDRLLTTYVDARAVADGAAASDAGAAGDINELLGGLPGDGAVLGWASATADRVTLELSGPAGDEQDAGGTELLGGLPQDAWIAATLPEVGDLLDQLAPVAALGRSLDLGEAAPPAPIDEALLDQLARDFGWMGDAAGFISGTSVLGVGAGVIADTTNDAESAAALQRLADSLAAGGDVRVTPAPGGAGFRIGALGVPIGANVVQEGGRVVAAGGAVSVEDLLDPGEDTLGSSEAFQRAEDGLGGDFDLNLYVNFVDLLELLGGIPDVTADPDFQSAAAVLEKLDYLAVGTDLDGDVGSLRTVLGLQESSDGADGAFGDAAAAALAP